MDDDGDSAGKSDLGRGGFSAADYFFSDRESNILSEFGWADHYNDNDEDLLSETTTAIIGAADRSAVAEASSAATGSAPNNASVSSTSSEDPPEKSTGSGEIP